MSNRRFFHLIRQYAALARRFGRSYNDAVEASLRLRAASYVNQGLSGDDLEVAIQKDIEAVMREYGQFAGDWSVSPADLL